MMNVIGRIKRCLPVISDTANKILEMIEKEIHVSTICQTSVSESGDKIIINVALKGVNRDDIDFNCSKDGVTIEIKNRGINNK